ncbi:MAG TPA: FAD-binding oxidoreductase, partial [Oceanospirillaceae bacterium]|nr:FAD-binding oxidoreductase [Oceanospirillaceae bacterium]
MNSLLNAPNKPLHEGVIDVSTFVSALQKILPVGAVILSKEGQRPFECDGLTVYQQLPLVTAMPET